MSESVSFEKAKTLSGLRAVWFNGLPSPWTQAAKGIFKIKNISCVSVVKDSADNENALQDWTGQDSYPAVIYNDEKPCTSWTEILFLAERLAPSPSLLPQHAKQRALMLGMSHEIIGEMGFCWCRRLMMFSLILNSPQADKGMRSYIEVLAKRYRYSEATRAVAQNRVIAILTMLSEQLAQQKQLGSPYLLGEELTALDIYWAVSAVFLQPLDEIHCPLPPGMRETYGLTSAQLGMQIDPLLTAHRDYIYQHYLGLPLQM